MFVLRHYSFLGRVNARACIVRVASGSRNYYDVESRETTTTTHTRTRADLRARFTIAFMKHTRGTFMGRRVARCGSWSCGCVRGRLIYGFDHFVSRLLDIIVGRLKDGVGRVAIDVDG